MTIINRSKPIHWTEKSSNVNCSYSIYIFPPSNLKFKYFMKRLQPEGQSRKLWRFLQFSAPFSLSTLSNLYLPRIPSLFFFCLSFLPTIIQTPSLCSSSRFVPPFFLFFYFSTKNLFCSISSFSVCLFQHSLFLS